MNATGGAELAPPARELFLFEAAERAAIVNEVAGVQDLDSSLVIAVKRCRRVGATRISSGVRVGEPHSDVIELNRCGGGIGGRRLGLGAVLSVASLNEPGRTKARG